MAGAVLSTAGAIIGGFFGGPVGAALGGLAGSLLGNILFPQKQTQPSLNDLRVQHGNYGAPIPIIRGTYRTAGSLIYNGDLVEHKHTEGGKGGPKVETKTYTVTYAIKLCRAPEGGILGIGRAWANGRLMTTSFPGDLPVVLYRGTREQVADPTLEGILGAGEVPGYRGDAYVVFTDHEVGEFGNALPNWEFEVEASGDPKLVRISTFYPTEDGNLTLMATVNWPVDGASMVDGQLVVYHYEGMNPTGEYREYRYNIATGVLEDSGGVTMFPHPNDAVDWDYIPAQNCNVAFGRQRGAGDFNVSRWYVAGVRGVEPVTPPAGTDEFYVVNTRPLKIGDFIYAAGHDSLGAPGAFVGKWGFRDSATLAGVPEVEYYDAEGGCAAAGGASTLRAEEISLTGSDDDYLYLLYATTHGVTNYMHLVKVDPVTMTEVKLWAVPSSSPAYAGLHNLRAQSSFTVFRDLIVINDQPGAPPAFANVWRIPDVVTDPFLQVGDDDVENEYWVQSGLSPFGSLGGGYVLTYDGIMKISSVENLGAIVQAICEQGPRPLSPAQIDVSDLTDEVIGYRVASQMTKHAAISALRPLYNFGAAAIDGVIVFKHHGGASVMTIEDGDLAAHEVGAAIPDKLGIDHGQDEEIPNTLYINYSDQERDYQPGNDQDNRLVGGSQTVATIEAPVVLNPAEATQIVRRALWQADFERDDFTFYLPRKYVGLTPLDVVTYGTRDYRITSAVNRPNGINVFKAKLSSVNIALQAENNGASGSGFRSTHKKTLVTTELVLLDIPPRADTDSRYGFDAAMAPSKTTGAWPGATLYKSVDGGTTYTPVATATSPAIIGHATTALGNFTGGSPGTGGAIGGGALALPETRVIPGGSPETVYTMQVVSDCDVTVAMSSGGVPVWVAHGQDSTNWVAYGAGVAYPPLWVLAGDWFSWKFGGTNPQDMRPQSQPHGALGVGVGGGSSGGTPGFDSTSTVEVLLHDPSDTLESINDAGLANGLNKAALRSGALWEIFQFQTATELSPGLYELSNLLRGVHGTTAYIAGHAIGDDFVLLSTVVNVPAPFSELNQEFLYKAVTVGLTLGATPAVAFTNTGDVDDPGGGQPPGGSGADFIGDNPGSPYVAPAHGLVPAPQVGDGALELVLMCTLDDVTGRYWGIPSWAGGGSPGSSGVQIENEGVSIGTGFSILDFNGAPVTAVDSGGGRAAIVVTGQVVTQDDGVTVLAASPTLDFTTGIAATNAGSGVTAIALANMAQSTIKGRAAGAGTGVPIDLSATQATAILDNLVGDSGSGGTKGLVPAPSAGDAAANKVLRADATWAAPTITTLNVDLARPILTMRMPRWVYAGGFSSASQSSQGLSFAGSGFAAGPAWANTFRGQTPYLRMTSTTAQNNVWCMRSFPNGLNMARGNAATLGGWYVRFNICLESVAVTSKVAIGLMIQANLDMTAGSVPSNQTDCAFFGFDNGDTNWSFMNNDNAGTCTKTSMGFAAQTTNKVYSLEIWCAGNAGNIFYQMTDQSSPGSPVSGSVSTNLPTSTSSMVLFMYMQGNTAAAASADTIVGLYDAYVELSPTFTI